jgi:O-antigen ligase
MILIVTCLGIAQSILGPTFLNPAVLQDDIRELGALYRISPISGLSAYRPTSVFVSAGRFSNFLIVCWLVALGFAGYLLLRSRRGRNLAFICVAVVAAGSLMSASRSVFMWNMGNAIVVAAAFLWGAPWRQGEARRILRIIQRSLLVVGLAVLFMMTLFPDQVASRLAIYNETLSLDSPASELVHRTRDYPLKNFMMTFEHEHWASGYGIGTASLGIQYVVRIMHAEPMRIGVENGYGQLILELGIAGLILWIFLSIAISVSAWNVVRRLRGTPWFPLGFVIFWYAFTLLIPMSYIAFVNYQDYVLNAYLWILLGILFRLPHLAQETVQAETAANLDSAHGQA